MRSRIALIWFLAPALALTACSAVLGESLDGENAAEPIPLPVLVQNCSPSVVLIQVQLSGANGQGSGVIVDPTGKVLTCHHVIDGARSVLIKTWNGGFFPSEGVLGLNPSADLALLKLNAQGLPYVEIGDSDALLPGEDIFVISAPKGVAKTVTDGIVSGLPLLSDLPEDYRSQLLELGIRPNQKLIQFTAPTYYGSSGGPLFNSRGEVVGIVSLRHEADNVYFAIPADLAKPHLPSTTVLKFEESGATPTMLGIADPELGELPEYIGCLEPESVQCEQRVPQSGEPVLRLNESLFVVNDSVRACYSDTGDALKRTKLMPQKGEFREVPGGFIYFSESDRNRLVKIDYEYRVQRVAVLQTVNITDYPELDDLLRKHLANELRERGFQVVPFLEVDAAVRAAAINVSATAFGKPDSLQPESIRKIAADTNAAMVVYSAVTMEKEFGYYVEAHGTGVFFLAFDGHTGKDAFAKTHSEAKNVFWGGRRAAREGCVKRAADRILDEFLGESD